ncbi:MAG TPA: helix-turn-helix transcriptional regulator [Acidimicrobiia bacterium]
MTAGSLAREARRRSGLTQAELARRIGTTQSAVARLESDRSATSLERLARIARACGLELVPTLRIADDSDWSVASTNLRLDVDARVRQHQAALRFASAGRAALAGRDRGA